MRSVPAAWNRRTTGRQRRLFEADADVSHILRRPGNVRRSPGQMTARRRTLLSKAFDPQCLHGVNDISTVGDEGDVLSRAS